MTKLNRKVSTKVFADTEGFINVRYHNTVIVRFNDNEIKLNTGGWNTFTTKRRMNQVSQEFDLGYYVSQKDFEWHVSHKGKAINFHKEALILER